MKWKNKEFFEEHYLKKKKSYRQIAEMVGVSKPTVRKYAKQLGIKSRTNSEAHSIDQEWDSFDNLNNLYNAQLFSITQIAKQYNVDYNIVRRRLIKHQIKLRSNKEAKKIRFEQHHNGLDKSIWYNYKWLKEKYGNYTINQIAKLTGYSYGYVRHALIKFNIPLRSGSDAVKVHSKSISKRMSKIWKNPEYRNKIKTVQSQNSKKIWRDSKYRKLQSESSKKLWKDPRYRNKIIKALNQPKVREKLAIIRSNQLKNGGISSLNKIVYEILDSLGIEYQKEYPLGFYCFDAYVPSHKLLIECQGEYWHSLKKAIQRDKAKATYVNKYFPDHKLIYLYEREFFSQNRIFERLKHELGIQEKIDFDLKQCTIEISPQSEAKKFVEHYHYLHKLGGCSHAYGAYLNDNLIAICCFGPIIRNEIATSIDQTAKTCKMLTRFCIKPGYNKHNFSTWMMAKCLKKFKKDCPNVNCIVSFSDSTFGHDGVIYKAGNWEFVHQTPPDYWYVDSDGYVMHKKKMYDHACKMKMKETDYAAEHKYRKVFGGIKSKWAYYFNRPTK